MMFINFLHFFAIVLEFPIPGRVGVDRNDNFFFSHSQPVPSRFVLKRGHNDFFFLAIFLEFPIPGLARMDQNDNIFFVSFSACPVPFWFQMKP